MELFLGYSLLPSVLWHCWLSDRKGIRPVKNWVVGYWPLPLTVSCFSEIQIGFTFLVPSHLGSPGQMAIKWVCVCVFLDIVCLQCFDAVGWTAGKASSPLSGGVLAWLFVWVEVQTCTWPCWCHCHSLSLASVKSRLFFFPFLYQLTCVVPDKEPLNVCVCVFLDIEVKGKA